MTQPASPQRGGTLRFRAEERCCASRVETAWAPRHPRSDGARVHSRPCAGGGYLRAHLEHGHVASAAAAATWSRACVDGRDGRRPGGRSGMGERDAHHDLPSLPQHGAPCRISWSRQHRLPPGQGIAYGPDGADGCLRPRVRLFPAAAISYHASACSSPRRLPKPGKTVSATSASTTTWSPHHSSGDRGSRHPRPLT